MRRFSTYLLLFAASLMMASDAPQQVQAQPSGEPDFSINPDDAPPPGGGQRPDGRRGRRGPGGERGPDGERGPGGPRGVRRGRPEGPPPPSPLMMALDVDQDHEISAAEIEGAIVALKRLDKNGDGKLTEDELRPPRRGPGEGGPGGPREGRPPREARRERGDGPPDVDRQARMLERFLQSDTDGDQKISRDEAQGRLKENFADVDTDGSGFIDEAEIKAMRGRGPEGRGREGRGREGRRPRPESDE